MSSSESPEKLCYWKQCRPQILVTSVVFGSLQTGHNGSHRWLRRHSTHTVDGRVHNIGSGLGALKHRGDSGSRSVMGVHVDRDIGELVTESSDEKFSSFRFQNSGHVLDGEDVGLSLDELIGKFQVVLKVVLVSRLVSDISRVSNGGLDDSSGLSDGFHSYDKVGQVVERVEHAEHVHSVLDGQLAELVDDVVWVVGVAHGVGSTEETLEWNVGDKLAEGTETFPRAFVQESHGDVERGTAPVLEGEEAVEGLGDEGGDGGHVIGTDTGGEERLVGISEKIDDENQEDIPIYIPEGCVSNKTSRSFANFLGKLSRSLFHKNITESSWRLGTGWDVRNRWGDDGWLQVRGERSGWSVDLNLSEIVEKFLSSVLAGLELEELWMFVDEVGVDGGIEEVGLTEHVEQERDVGLKEVRVHSTITIRFAEDSIMPSRIIRLSVEKRESKQGNNSLLYFDTSGGPLTLTPLILNSFKARIIFAAAFGWFLADAMTLTINES